MATLLRMAGVLMIIAWLILFLWIKLVFAAVHLLLAIGVILLLLTLFGARRAS